MQPSPRRAVNLIFTITEDDHGNGVVDFSLDGGDMTGAQIGAVLVAVGNQFLSGTADVQEIGIPKETS